MAVEVLRSKGVPEDRILFLNLIASPEGAAKFAEKFPKLRVVTAFVDAGLDERKYVYKQSTSHLKPSHSDTSLQLHRSRPRRLWRPLLHPLEHRTCLLFIERPQRFHSERRMPSQRKAWIEEKGRITQILTCDVLRKQEKAIFG